MFWLCLLFLSEAVEGYVILIGIVISLLDYIEQDSYFEIWS